MMLLGLDWMPKRMATTKCTNWAVAVDCKLFLGTTLLIEKVSMIWIFFHEGKP